MGPAQGRGAGRRSDSSTGRAPRERRRQRQGQRQGQGQRQRQRQRQAATARRSIAERRRGNGRGATGKPEAPPGLAKPDVRPKPAPPRGRSDTPSASRGRADGCATGRGSAAQAPARPVARARPDAAEHVPARPSGQAAQVAWPPTLRRQPSRRSFWPPSPRAGSRAGFEIADGGVRIGSVTLTLAGKDAGRRILRWRLEGVASSELDGLPTEIVPPGGPAGPAPVHPNGVVRVDHVVAFTPQLKRTVPVLEAAGLDLRRVREGPTPGGRPTPGVLSAGGVDPRGGRASAGHAGRRGSRGSRALLRAGPRSRGPRCRRAATRPPARRATRRRTTRPPHRHGTP